jgi:two-component system, LuxR family, response regulator FixJ
MQPLSPREREVFALVAKGLSSKEIGRLLQVSPRTVEMHRAKILAKCGARNTVDLLLRMRDGRAEQA